MVTDSAWSRLRSWLRHAPAERVPLPAVPAVWTTTEIMHAAHVPGLFPGAVAIAAVGVAYGLGERRSESEHPRLAGAELAAATGAVGAWVTAGTVLGPLAGPDHLMSITFAVASAFGYWWLRGHEAVRAARARRDAAAEWTARKAEFHRLAERIGLRGAHLLAWDETYLGEAMLIDTRGTGRRASQLSGRDVAERIAEIEMIPVGRVDVTTERIAGRLRISIRRGEPWADPIGHPLLTPSSKFAKHVPYPATIREPLTVGIDPETGAPLPITLWDEEGGKVVLIVGKKAAGKTVALNCLTERITACPDAVLLQVNLAKVLEDDCWSPLAAVNALASVKKSRQTLEFAASAGVARSRSKRRTAVHIPTPDQPLYVVKIDEIDAVSELPDCQRWLRLIASKCRGEGLALVIAGQRATAKWVGGADVRANIDYAMVGKVARSGEARHVSGQDIDLPDIGAYGERHAGVFGVTELPAAGDYDAKGRTFYLRDIPDLERIVSDRLPGHRPHVLEPALQGLTELWARIATAGPDDDDQDDEDSPHAPLLGADPDEDDKDDEDGYTPPAMSYDPSKLTAKVAEARAVGAGLVAVPALSPDAERRLAERTEREHRQFLAAYTDASADLPDADQATLRTMLAAPTGVSIREAERCLPYGRDKVHRQLTRWRAQGAVELRGRKSQSRWHAIPGGAAPGVPYLHVVPNDAEGSAS
jgi:hypothetical protein